jgi:hypothetical protein
MPKPDGQLRQDPRRMDPGTLGRFVEEFTGQLTTLGHASLQSTEIYLRADPTEKLEALTAIAQLSLQRGRFRPPDKLLAMLNAVGGSKNYAE